ncbi:MAG TPA: TetR family transcriptional regulator [Acidimicrobiales bacterium]
MREPCGLRERKKARTRDAIVAAAIDLFETKGYDATTIDEIAEAAEVSPRTFFRYFDSKVDVLMGRKDEPEGDIPARLATRPPEEGPIEATRQVLHQELLSALTEDPLFVRQVRIMLGTPSLLAMAREHFHEHLDEMAADFATRMDVPPDDYRAHVVASAVSNTLWTVVARWVADGSDAERLVEMLDEAFDLLATGFDRPAATPAPTPTATGSA